MTKADQIRKLYATGKSTSEIADIVGCGTSYVRVCARQRVPGGNDPNKDYQARIDRLAKDHGDREQARIACRQAWRAARDRGLSRADCCSTSGGAYARAMRKTALEKFCVK